MKSNRGQWIFLCVTVCLLVFASSAAAQLVIWANDGGDKVTRDELRAHQSKAAVLNSVWDGQTISIFAARNMDRSIARDYSHPQRLPDLPKVAIAGAEKGHQDFRVGDRNRCFKHQQKTAAEPP